MKFGTLFETMKISKEELARTQTVLETMDADTANAVWNIRLANDFNGYATGALVFGGAMVVSGLLLKGISKFVNYDKIVRMIE